MRAVVRSPAQEQCNACRRRARRETLHPPRPGSARWRAVSADVLLSDPPYCLLTRRRKDGDLRDPKHKKIDRGPVRRFETVREFRDFTRQWLEVAVAHLAPDAPLVLWMNLLGREPMTAACRELGYGHVRGEFVWGKRTREGNSGEEILRVVETALVFTRSPAPPLTP